LLHAIDKVNKAETYNNERIANGCLQI
jgi:hypothetical protein